MGRGRNAHLCHIEPFWNKKVHSPSSLPVWREWGACPMNLTGDHNSASRLKLLRQVVPIRIPFSGISPIYHFAF